MFAQTSLALPLLAAAGAAALAALAIVLTKDWHGRLSMDSSEGVQKFHTAPTPRVGGLALMAGILAALPFLGGETFRIVAMVAGCAIFAFAAGLVEDITKSVSPRNRLIAALVSGLAFVCISGAVWPLVSPFVPDGAGTVVTWSMICLAGAAIAFALAGVTNAVNIIDGFHGLAAGTLIIMLLTIGFLAASEGDAALTGAAFVFAAAVFGFMLVNFPSGHLFFGDAGAYAAGLVVGALAVLLAARTDISAFVAILVLAYPVWETIFSIHRKTKRPGHSPSQPDGVHMHMLVSRRYARFIAWGLDRPDLRNAITGALMWPFSIVATVMAVFAQGTSIGGAIGILVFGLFYGRVYRVVSLQRPSFLQARAAAWGWDEAARYRRRSAAPAADLSAKEAS